MTRQTGRREGRGGGWGVGLFRSLSPACCTFSLPFILLPLCFSLNQVFFSPYIQLHSELKFTAVSDHWRRSGITCNLITSYHYETRHSQAFSSKWIHMDPYKPLVSSLNLLIRNRKKQTISRKFRFG